MKKNILLTFLCLLFALGVQAQTSKTFLVEGTVTVKGTNDPIPFAQVLIKEINQWGFTNDKGEFKIAGVLTGSYNIQAFALGYTNYELPIIIKGDVKNFRLLMTEDNLALEEITVTAQSGETMNSSSRINKNAIQHLQATSISDVMQLMPGNLINNPSLTDKNKITIRTISDDLAGNNGARGVGFMVNGGKVSSDASLYSASNAPITTDFRDYSTENIESIEVIKGVVSAEYGDLTSGAVLVTTKAGRTPFEVRFKVDPQAKAISANKGFSLGRNNGYVNLDVDYANASADRRSPTATFDRTNFGIAYSNTFNSDRKPFRFNARFAGSFISNNTKADPDANYNSFTKTNKNSFNLALYGNWMLNKSWISSLNYNLSANYGTSNMQEFSEVKANQLPTTNTYYEGVNLGYFTKSIYNRDFRVNEIPIYLNAKVSGNLNKKIGKALSKTLLGLEWNTKGNNGRGEWYGEDIPQNFRERKYSDIPFMSDFSLFLEEKLTIPINKTSLELIAGARLTKMIISGYDYNPTLDPRFNAKYTIFKGTKKNLFRNIAIRGGWGILQKMPSINLLYGGDTYIDFQMFKHAESGLALFDTVIESEILNYNFLPTKTRNAEIGANLNIGGVKIELTYFNEHYTNGVSLNYEYFDKNVKLYNTVTDKNADPIYKDGMVMIKDKDGNYVENSFNMRNEIITRRKEDNRAYGKKWGLEYDINFGKIKPINTSIIVNGSYMKSTSGADGYEYSYIGGDDPIDSKQAFPYISVFENSAEMAIEKNYDRFSTNISFITNIPKIRMVVSLTAQCVWMDRYWNSMDAATRIGDDGIAYRDPIAYVDSKGEMKPFSDYYTTTDENLKRRLKGMIISDSKLYNYEKNSLNPYFMANIRITKEIGKFAAISFYANNFTNSRPIIVNNARPNYPGTRKNTPIYFGAELKITL